MDEDNGAEHNDEVEEVEESRRPAKRTKCEQDGLYHHLILDDWTKKGNIISSVLIVHTSVHLSRQLSLAEPLYQYNETQRPQRPIEIIAVVVSITTVLVKTT